MKAHRWRRWRERMLLPGLALSDEMRDALTLLQAERMRGVLPALCLSAGGCAVLLAFCAPSAESLSAGPRWRRLLPPLLIAALCFGGFLASLRARRAPGARIATRRLGWVRLGVPCVAGMAGLWAADEIIAAGAGKAGSGALLAVAFAFGVMACATALSDVPRAALTALVAGLAPVVAGAALSGDVRIWFVAWGIVVLAALQGRVVALKFREAAALLAAQHRLNHLAETDPLTGLANRRSFARRLEESLSAGHPVLVVLTDMDGFKAANDRFGHHAGDAILLEVGRRLAGAAAEALCVARIGGDEFALLFDAREGCREALAVVGAFRSVELAAIRWAGRELGLGMSFGAALSPADGVEATLLLRIADTRLYREKAERRSGSDSARDAVPSDVGA